MLNMNMMANTHAGKRHTETLMENQDKVLMFEDDTIAVLAVADGCSSCEAAAEAAELTVQGIVEFARLDSIWNIRIKNMKQLLLDTLDRMYLRSESPYDDLCATLGFVVVHKPTHRYIAMTIGDCSVFAVDRDLKATVLLTPLNLLSKNQTVFANSFNAKGAMRVKSGRMEFARGFVLYTDGASDLANEPEILRHLAIKTISMQEDSQTVLEAYVQQLLEHTQDDVTVGVLMVGSAEAASQTNTDRPDIETENKENKENTCENKEIEPDSDHTLAVFLRKPRTPESLIEHGYCTGTSFLYLLAPYLQAGLVTVKDGKLIWKNP